MRTKQESVWNPGFNEYAAIALVSCAILIYQIVMTRILSVVLWYHWAFLSISLAMLGLGVSGVWFTLQKPGSQLLARLLAASAISLPLSILLIFHFGRPGAGWKMLTLCIFSMTGPMILMGAAVCLLLLQTRGKAFGRMYSADLLGAFLGALSIIPLMHGLSAPQIVVLTAGLPCMALFLLYPKHRKTSAAIAGLLAGLLLWGSPLKLQYSKLYTEKNLQIIFEKWTPTARLTIFDSIFFKKGIQDAFGWGMGKNYTPSEHRQFWLEQDGTAGTPITRYEGDPQTLSFLSYDVTAAGYLLRRPETVAIIGGGGGRDILTAYSLGARNIDAIELNAAIIRALSGPFRNFSGDVYHLPGVQAIHSEGRSYMTRTSKSYDLIQISLIDSWAATTAGAYALAENNLYTVEAFNLYFKRLAPEGILCISRWMKGGFHIEGASLVLLMEESLRKAGITNPRQHIMAVQGGAVVTVLAKLTPFTAQDLEKILAVSREKGLTLLYPETPSPAEENAVHQALTKGASYFIQQGLDMRAATDDRPFFFHVIPVFSKTGLAAAKSFGHNGIAVYALRFTMLAVTLLTLSLFALPFLVNAGARKRHRGFGAGSFYFTFIGISFMLVEIPWIQHFILYLGHPSHAVTTVLSCLLIGAGTGSLASSRIPLQSFKQWGIGAPLYLGLAQFLMPFIFEHTLGWPFPAKALTSLSLIFPAGFMMGFFFPQGILNFGDADKAWFWALNGAASTLASVLSLALAMEFGFTRVVWLGITFYLSAWLLLKKSSSQEVHAPETSHPPPSH